MNWKELEEYPKEEGALGMCPKAILKMAKDNTPHGEHSIRKILACIGEGTRQVYLERCRDHKEAHDKKEIRKQFMTKKKTQSNT
jgi:hypothetical protein